MKNYKKYLPSRKFTYFILIFMGILVLIFILSTVFFGKNSFLGIGQKDKKLTTQNLTMNELLKKDSDGDGVMDWEEGLWGTDPNNTKTFENMPDSEYIKGKRELLQTPGGSGTSTDLTETEKFAQQFFASLAALKQSGQFDSSTIKNMSTSLGQEIANPTIIDNYNSGNIRKNKDDSLATQEEYYLKIGDLFETYKNKGVGDELDTVSAIAVSGPNATSPEIEGKLNTISKAYQEYAQKMISIPVPESLASYHLRIINSSNNTGIAVRNMTQIGTDPIIGLSGVAQYQKYSEDLIKAVEELEAILSINGIIN